MEWLGSGSSVSEVIPDIRLVVCAPGRLLSHLEFIEGTNQISRMPSDTLDPLPYGQYDQIGPPLVS